MSSVLGIFGAEPSHESLVHRMLGTMGARGSDHAAVWQRFGATLAVARNGWERAPELSGDALVLWDDNLVIAADASLYYRDDLKAKLAASPASALPLADGATPSHLILAAYRTWGDACVQHLEGDFAFVIWDAKARRVFCARDFVGSRPLFFTEARGALIVASSLAAVREHPLARAGLNSALLAETAANLWIAPQETAYEGVLAIPPGFIFTWSGPGTGCETRSWTVPATNSSSGAGLSFDAAAEELRERLSRAVEERLGTGGTRAATVWMSGGRDSTAVFATAQANVRRRTRSADITPVSISYPPGDCGREDETIAAVADFWGTAVHWIDSGTIPFLDDAQGRARRRDEPYDPPYAAANRALARASRAQHTRIALDGWGGDQLFQMTLMRFADLFRSGQWRTLAREWRKLAVPDFRFFFRTAITPVLPPFLRTLATVVRGGRPLTDDFAPWIPPWIRPGWTGTLLERQELHRPPRKRGSFAHYELGTFLTSATVGRTRGALSALALEEGVEVRSPLHDQRIVELAVGRPAAERRSARDTKLLLRAAMRGLLPDAVLAPRANRTGITDDYLRRALKASYPSLLRQLVTAPVVLADLGIVDTTQWEHAAEQCLGNAWSNEVAIALVSTLQTELWLRGYQAPPPRLNGSYDDGRLMAVLPPGERPGFTTHHGGTRCTSNRNSSVSELSGS